MRQNRLLVLAALLLAGVLPGCPGMPNPTDTGNDATDAVVSESAADVVDATDSNVTDATDVNDSNVATDATDTVVVGDVTDVPVTADVVDASDVPVMVDASDAGTAMMFVATLSGAEEVPPVPGTGSGTATFTLSGDGTMLSYTVHHSLAALTGGHIHLGFGGENGPVSIPFTSMGTDIVGTAAVTAAQVTALQTGGLYVNLHTAAHAGGEIRGQILRMGETLYTTQLSGYQEVPPVTTAAVGAAAVIVDAAHANIRYHVSTSMVTATAAHFHNGVGGSNGPVVYPFPSAASPIDGTQAITAADYAILQSGGWYVNVHSAAHAGGEIRGQLILPGETLYTTTLSGFQEVPALASAGTGAAELMVSFDQASVRFAATTSLTPTGAHFHESMASTNGPVIAPVMTPGMNMTGNQTITAANAANIAGGLWYFNVHTAAHAGGELRGQMLLPGEALFVANLTGAQEVPAVTTTSTGSGALIESPDRSTVRFRVITTATPTAAHVHTAPGAVNGGVTFSLGTTGATMTGSNAVTAAQVTDLESGRWYFNVHTTANAGGEIRGQILRPGETLYTSVLSGTNEIPPVITTATGGVGYILDVTQMTLSYQGVLAGITPTAAHIHTGNATTNGPVLYPLTLVSGNPVGMQAVTAADVANLNGTMLYTNVHSAAHAGGELRAQITRQ